MGNYIMKKLGVYLFNIATAVALVACNSGGGDVLSLSATPTTCSVASGPNIMFSYSGLATGESAFFNYTNPAGAIILTNCVVGDSTCPFYANSGSFGLTCQNIASFGGVGKYIFTLKQGAGNAAVTITVTP